MLGAVKDSEFPIVGTVDSSDRIPVLQSGNKNTTAPAVEVARYVADEIDKGDFGKVLTDNNYTDEEVAKLAGIEANAQVNVIEGISIDGNRVRPSNKVADIHIPTELSELGTDADHTTVSVAEKTAWGAKYDKPWTGIPKTDLASEVQTSLSKADTAYQVPVTGIPASELSDAVQTSLGKADTAYQLPSDGIPKTDLTPSVRASLDLADSSIQSVAGLVASVQYDSVGKRIYFYDKSNTVIGTSIDTTDFIKDGMVNSVEIENGYLVVSFNTDAGKESISILLTDIFDPSNYYNTTVTDQKLALKVDKVSGKGLSESDYTNAEKTKLGNIEAGAQVNVLEGVQVNGTDLTINNKKVNVSVPTALSELSDDSIHRLVTDTEKSTWSGKQDAIQDLTTIRSGAASGATAVQPAALNNYAAKSDFNASIAGSVKTFSIDWEELLFARDKDTLLSYLSVVFDEQFSTNSDLEDFLHQTKSFNCILTLPDSSSSEPDAKYTVQGISSCVGQLPDDDSDNALFVVNMVVGEFIYRFDSDGTMAIQHIATKGYVNSNYYNKTSVDAAVNAAKSNWINDGSSNVKLTNNSQFLGTVNRSVAEGNNNTVGELGETVANVHVEGNYCVALGDQSHAEGYCTQAGSSHAHSEGRFTIASGTASHAEGCAYTNSDRTQHTNITASGHGSHAEGYAADVNSPITASGKGAHAEGNGTTAVNDGEHAEGRYNKSVSGKTLSSVGCGTSASKKNALEVDIDGTVYVKGVGTFDGTNSTPGTNDVATVIAGKQDTLVSGTSIKTINNQSLLGSGNISISGGSGGASNWEDVGSSSVQINDSTALASEPTASNQLGAVAAGYKTYANKRYSSSQGQMTVAGVCTGDNPNTNNYKRWFKNGDTITAVPFKTDTEGSRTIPETTIGDIGVGAHAEGIYSSAVGNNSHAEGNDTVALNSGCHSEGYHTIALGQQSHAEGNRTDAWGNQAHSEGKFTRASGECAHVEGLGSSTSNPNLASGKASHVEGEYNTASGEASHAEGSGTQATGSSSHAEGSGTVASSGSSHAEGLETSAYGSYSHAEGYGTLSTGMAAHSEGESDQFDNTSADGRASHAEGYATHASGDYSHSEGKFATAKGKCSHVEGWGYDNNSEFPVGWDSVAVNGATHVEGKSNLSVGFASHAQGHRTVAGAPSIKASYNGSESEFILIGYNSGGSDGHELRTTGYVWDSKDKPKIISDSLNIGVGDSLYIYGDPSDAHYTCTVGYTFTENDYTNFGSNSFQHTEGEGTITRNLAEHAEGSYNVSNQASTTYGNAGNTQHSIGIGTETSGRKNAFEVMQNGDVYVLGLGGYDGTNAATSGVKTLQTVISDLSTLIQQVQNIASAGL